MKIDGKMPEEGHKGRKMKIGSGFQMHSGGCMDTICKWFGTLCKKTYTTN